MGINFETKNKKLLVTLSSLESGDKIQEFLELFKVHKKQDLDDLQKVIFKIDENVSLDMNLVRFLSHIKVESKKDSLSVSILDAGRELVDFLKDQGVDVDFLDSKKLKKKSGKTKIDMNFINPFLDGVMKVLEVQCFTVSIPGSPYLKNDGDDVKTDIAGVIGLNSNYFEGSIALCFPEQTFLNVMGHMLGEEYQEIDDELEDGAGEILNMVFGQAKIVLNQEGYGIEKAIPTVVRGKDLKIKHLTQGPSIVLPFDSNSGGFNVVIGINSSE